MLLNQQNQADALDLDKTVLQVVVDASSEHSYNELRKLLGQFLFKGDDVSCMYSASQVVTDAVLIATRAWQLRPGARA